MEGRRNETSLIQYCHLKIACGALLQSSLKTRTVQNQLLEAFSQQEVKLFKVLLGIHQHLQIIKYLLKIYTVVVLEVNYT